MKFIENINVIINIYRIQAYDSIMCGYFCFRVIGFMLKGKSVLEYINVFSLNDYKKNGKIILRYFQQNLNKLKYIVIFAINIDFFFYIYIFKKTSNLSIVYSKYGHEYEKIFKKKTQLKY